MLCLRMNHKKYSGSISKEIKRLKKSYYKVIYENFIWC